MVEIINEDELVQYLIVNEDLGMSAGKVAAQAGHACTICAVKEGTTERFNQWYNLEQKKIVCRAHQKVLEKLEQSGFYAVRDNGYTEIPPKSLTVISLGIMSRKEASPYTKRLQLLK